MGGRPAAIIVYDRPVGFLYLVVFRQWLEGDACRSSVLVRRFIATPNFALQEWRNATCSRCSRQRVPPHHLAEHQTNENRDELLYP